ncbi:hypothetical protein EVAR_83228_1 [Eumeta japonica]|uniref:Uncharacterized protein n=1 Tax=Eumeta variegata TaxID=151549 RepID=A0A4C1Y304_EUMVA|nr:hypothetical protein EVAR_83228_1 [Eumeta japonica]
MKPHCSSRRRFTPAVGGRVRTRAPTKKRRRRLERRRIRRSSKSEPERHSELARIEVSDRQRGERRARAPSLILFDAAPAPARPRTLPAT